MHASLTSQCRRRETCADRPLRAGAGRLMIALQDSTCSRGRSDGAVVAAAMATRIAAAEIVPAILVWAILVVIGGVTVAMAQVEGRVAEEMAHEFAACASGAWCTISKLHPIILLTSVAAH